jgi:uncharacterized membrane protein
MSIKSGIWNPSFLLAVAVVLSMFAVLYGVVTFVSVWTESAALALIVTLGVIVASLVLMAPDEAVQIQRPWREVYVALHYVFPKFPAATALTWKLAGAEPVEDWAPLFSSLAFGAACYGGAFALFRRKDF